ncbi:MAG: T9SS type A sorting domain-containing protein [Reichenbachiella sp.]
MRTSIASSGSLLNSASGYSLQTTLGQSSLIDITQGETLSLSQGFLQPLQGSFSFVDQIDFELFPNPTLDKVNLVFKSELQDYTVSIIHLDGRTVYQHEYQSSSQITIDLQDLPVGFYIVIIKHRSRTVGQKKLIKA